MLLPCGEFVSTNDVEIIVSYLKLLQKKGTELNKRLNK